MCDLPAGPAVTNQTRTCGTVCPCPLEIPSSYFCRTIKFIPLRSPSNDRARQLVGSIGHTNQYLVGPSYLYLSFMLGYDSSFRPTEILNNIFGPDLVEICDDAVDLSFAKYDCKRAHSIVIQGGQYQGQERNPHAWFADYFYLSQTYQGVISFEPTITNLIFNFDLYLGFDAALPGLYFRTYGPVVHSHWHSHYNERILDDPSAGRLPHPAGYFSVAQIPNAKLLQSFTCYAGGARPEQLDPDSLDIDNTIVFQPLAYSRITRNSRHRTGLADMRLELGWNVFQNEDYHLGFYLQGVAPTAPKRCPQYLFEPIIGNNGHWEMGGGISGSYIFWANDDGESHIGFMADINLTHMLQDKEQLSLELKCKPNSIYMLAQKMATNLNVSTTEGFQLPGVATGEIGQPPENPGYQFALEYAPVANLSTVNVLVNTNLKVDIDAMLNFTCRGFSLDVGYNFWMAYRHQMSRPDAGCRDNLNSLALPNDPPNPMARWALKGDSRVFGYINTDQSPVPLSATQSQATINNGRNQEGPPSQALYDGDLTCSGADFNFFVDTSVNAYVYDDPLANSLDNCPGSGIQIRTSKTPKLLSGCDLDYPRIRGISHKFFAHVHFTHVREKITPHLGFGGFVEVGTNENSTKCALIDSLKSRIDVAISQWGIWLKGGFTFTSG